MKNKSFSGLWKVILYMILGGLLGIFGSRFERKNQFLIKERILKFQDFFVENIFIIYFTILILSIFVTLIFYFLGKKQILKSIENDEDEINENMISIYIGISSISMYILFALLGGVIVHISLNPNVELNVVVLVVISVILYSLFNVVFQKKSVENLKRLYPEKKGDVYSLKFQKDWEESLDEREKVVLYYSGYKTFKVLTIIMFTLLVLSIPISEMYKNIYPTILLALILSISTGINLYYSKKSKNIL